MRSPILFLILVSSNSYACVILRCEQLNFNTTTPAHCNLLELQLHHASILIKGIIRHITHCRAWRDCKHNPGPNHTARPTHRPQKKGLSTQQINLEDY